MFIPELSKTAKSPNSCGNSSQSTAALTLIPATILSENNAEKCITFVMHVNDKLKINYYLMGLGRLELPTLRLSGTHSNQLSYKP